MEQAKQRTAASAPSAAASRREEAPKAKGRTWGKRSDPDFEHIAAYIRKETMHAVRVALVKQQPRGEISGLVQDLLDRWLKSRH
jgi:hypothetical protein